LTNIIKSKTGDTLERLLEEIEELFDKYSDKMETLKNYKDLCYFSRHEIYNKNKEWFNSPNEKAEAENKGRYEKVLNNKMSTLYKLFGNIHNAMDELNTEIDECDSNPYDENIEY
jgi:hypoxanthine phosphoribosyltransferase